MKPWIIIAAYNEQKNIGKVVEGAKKHSKHVVVVDDGSTDKTADIAKSRRAIVLRHAVNLGKGAAVKTGCDYAIKKGAKTFILMDGDGQHQTKDIPRLIKALQGKDIVFTYRTGLRAMPLVFRIGNWIINKVTSLLYGIKLQDTQCGFRAMTSKTYKKIRWNSTGYPMESEMIANTGKYHLKYTEIPIKTIYTQKYKGTTILDGMKIVANLLIWRLWKK